MTNAQLLERLLSVKQVDPLASLLDEIADELGDRLSWTALGGRENNRGTVEASGDPGRAIVERITNAVDAILEKQHSEHGGIPDCRTPREAALAWLGVPQAGLASMTLSQRRNLAQAVTVRLMHGDGRERRTIDIMDRGIGLHPDEMPSTILGLNESNKLQKHYLAGVYGQGGSATFAVSKYTIIVSRKLGAPAGFTVVRYEDLPPEQFKVGRYVYFTIDGAIPACECSSADLPETGTLVRHLGFDLSGYDSPLGPNSLYGMLNQALFDPIMPVWLDHEIRPYRRVIKGSRNALNGAVDEGDDRARGPDLDHHVAMFKIPLSDLGLLGIEYWLLKAPPAEKKEKRPSAAFINPAKPILLTMHGQTHAEMPSSLIRKTAGLTFLTHRFICHVDCNDLSPMAKRALFVSNREEARKGHVHDAIQEEIVRAIKSDDELRRFNDEARAAGHREQDEEAQQYLRREVTKLLRAYGAADPEPVGGTTDGSVFSNSKPVREKRSRPRPSPIELVEPPTYVKVVWHAEDGIPFYPGQRRWIRIETNAFGHHHNADDPAKSQFNFIPSSPDIKIIGSSPLNGGRMRVIVEATASAIVGDSATLVVELRRRGMATLSAEKAVRIVEQPPAQIGERRVNSPEFEVIPIDDTNDPMWTQLSWPDSITEVASGAVTDNQRLLIYYSSMYPPFADAIANLERRDLSLAEAFRTRYKVWVALHSILLYRDQISGDAGGDGSERDEEAREKFERLERCRLGTLAASFALREVQDLAATAPKE